ncbi:DUF2586 family protein [Weeksella virosa]|uniref:Tail sheath protein n=1 Tax=Weeksella virosa (strain ATCC 43766 / DSM 16922 / JCM 21250 / CCUG 30538 / CDC 9751 / IAM 14551 / NBRC 16016 / NCTC 11634 / CL345/78) TaxID=865938 RepID=F0P2U8_WEEVC|nr:DUF2586 family protein [Weeksella virosa]ADX66838.1 hypothetical protein Weevi_0112 [Weeksella virosa DSM 16922]VEH63438.1 Uncharacterised protein [Weeksella virosa]
MGLPRVIFNVSKNGLNYSTGEVQKIAALIGTGVTVTDKVQLGKSYQIFSLKDAEDLGITATENAFMHQQIKDFYSVAGSGVELWLMLVSDATTYEQMSDINADYLTRLISDAKGRVRVVGLIKKATTVPTLTAGIDSDVSLAVPKLQALADDFADKYFPFRAIISANNFSGMVSDLRDYTESDFNRVSMLIANNDGANEASIGLNLGKQASIPSQRSQARVKDGAVLNEQAYFTNGEAVESLSNALDTIHDKGYTFFRTFAGRSGYYFTDDATLTNVTDDFKSLANGFVMDEAVLIGYDTLIEELSDEVPLSDNGSIHPAILKNWQANIERNIKTLMVDQGKLSAVRCVIDTNQNIVSTGVLNVEIRLLPVGYAKEIIVNIGFTTQID